ncbi:MAG: hypothetical protein U9O49_00560 [Candidatus Thermoplasmatota archaeon]|nr:hypothetical protein [Candidatus Thermoplasmatota archaeon]
MVESDVKLRKLGVMSVAKIYAVLGAIGGFIVGLIVSIMSLAFGSVISAVGGTAAMSGIFMGGVFAVIVMPIAYAIFGFIGGAIGAFLYNVVAGWVGGIEMKFE